MGLVDRVFANGPGDQGSIPGRVLPKTLKMLLDTFLLNIQHYKLSVVAIEKRAFWSPSTKFANFTYFICVVANELDCDIVVSQFELIPFGKA